MGGFSGKKKIYVSSVTYNLAGDEKDHIKFLPTTVTTKVIANTNFDLTDTLRTALLQGPGMRMRTFGKWARDNGYSNQIGLQAGQLHTAANLDVDLLTTLVPHADGEKVNIDNASIGMADYSYWVDQWMADNHPSELDDAYTIDYKEDINTIFITFVDGHSYSFQPAGFDPLAQYLYVSYLITTVPEPYPTVFQPPVTVDSPSGFPSTTGWELETNENFPGSATLTTTVTTTVEYSDGSPGSTSSDTTAETVLYSEQEAAYSKLVYDGTNTDAGVDELISIRWYQQNRRHVTKGYASSSRSTTETLPGGVTKTTTVTTSGDVLKNDYSYVSAKQRIVVKRWSDRRTLIYAYGTGNPVFDSMFGANKDSGVYFPFMPIRQEERMLSNSYYGDIYRRNLKAYPKAFGKQAKYTDLIKTLERNRSIGDVDHGFIVFGVSVNTKEKAGRKYIYKYFQTLLAQGGGGVGFDAWRSLWNLADIRVKAWVNWREAQSNPSNPLYGTAEPPKGYYPPSPTKFAQVISNQFNYNMILMWESMVEVTGTGLGRPGAKVGDVWWTVGADQSFNQVIYSGGIVGTAPTTYSSATLTWQDGVNTYRSISTIGLNHVNIVYKGKGVDHDIGSSLADREVSGFIVPLHEGVFRAMSLVDQTQMSQGNAYLVLNSYEEKKQKWYQSSWFKIIMVIIIIVVSIIFPPAGGAGAGLLGTAAAVGTTLGFAGTMALVVGALANAIAAMILTQIIMAGATALFGDKIGMIVGTVASIVAVSAGTSMANGGTITSGFQNLTSAENILKFTDAAGRGLATFMEADTNSILKQQQEVIDEYNAKGRDIDKLWQDNLGYGRTEFDPLNFTDSLQQNFIPENRDVFLGRTLLTGSEIADMTNNLLSNFASITTSTELV